jgi:sec-independent protein translocase protein TatA
MSLGPAEILVVLVLALIVFGPKRLPEVGRQVGGALRELRKVQDTVQHEIRSVLDDTTGSVRTMFPSEPEPRAIEPDLGDEHTDPAAVDRERPDIDGLSGGTFS